MKRFFSLLTAFVLALTLAGCGSKPVTTDKPAASPTVRPPVPGGTSAVPSPTIEPIKAPQVVISEESVKRMAELVFADSKPSELIAFIDGNIGEVTAKEADSMLLILESVQKAWLDYYINSMEFSANAESVEKTAWKNELASNGFSTVAASGREIPVFDYSLYRKWEDFISDWFRDYIALIQQETDAPVVHGSQLAISKDELEKRLLSACEYIQNYPRSIRVNEVISLYDTYLYSYLYGYEDDPVIDFSTGKISEDYFNRYREFANQHPGSEAASVVSEYADLIEKNGFVMTEELENYLVEVFSALEDKLIVVRNDIGRQLLMERMEKLLPAETGFTWNCIGSDGYTHTAQMQEIHTEDGKPVYTVTGIVNDPSDINNINEQNSISMEYRIDNQILYQIKSAPAMIESDFDEMEIIRYPLVVGHRWLQYPEVDGISDTAIETEIIGITQENGVNLYKVEYRDLTNGDYERRLIQTGKGTVSFTKLYSDGINEPYEIGYDIDEESTGFLQP